MYVPGTLYLFSRLSFSISGVGSERRRAGHMLCRVTLESDLNVTLALCQRSLSRSLWAASQVFLQEWEELITGLRVSASEKENCFLYFIRRVYGKGVPPSDMSWHQDRVLNSRGLVGVSDQQENNSSEKKNMFDYLALIAKKKSVDDTFPLIPDLI